MRGMVSVVSRDVWRRMMMTMGMETIVMWMALLSWLRWTMRKMEIILVSEWEVLN